MTFLDKIISDKFKDNSGSLCEKDNDSRGRTFTMERKIKDRDNEYELYKFDKDNIELFPYFSDVSNLKKMNDYVLIFDKKETINILLIELKKSSQSKYKEQLIAGECFVRFLIDSYNRTHTDNTVKEENIKFKKIRIIDEKSNNKRKSKGKCFEEKEGYCRHLNPKKFDFFQYS